MKVGFMDGSFPMPADDSPIILRWRRANSMVCSWIKSSMAPDLMNQFMFMHDARKLWKSLEQRFEKHRHDSVHIAATSENSAMTMQESGNSAMLARSTGWKKDYHGKNQGQQNYHGRNQGSGGIVPYNPGMVKNVSQSYNNGGCTGGPMVNMAHFHEFAEAIARSQEFYASYMMSLRLPNRNNVNFQTCNHVSAIVPFDILHSKLGHPSLDVLSHLDGCILDSFIYHGQKAIKKKMEIASSQTPVNQIVQTVEMVSLTDADVVLFPCLGYVMNGVDDFDD
ncbi:OLC1v1013451C1 [Oldenlandia corymbosa var. corymbosa]|uniref:OLC1v1013451C1 n=1 Tax=Oldenlandia corymbosa var. corymbosa TaxID=529605 RepID=A0AAV1DZ38_OLDCO|nr:OLC1v1013451C1 [Oldenlandia corymbosa var. corymbosa]